MKHLAAMWPAGILAALLKYPYHLVNTSSLSEAAKWMVFAVFMAVVLGLAALLIRRSVIIERMRKQNGNTE